MKWQNHRLVSASLAFALTGHILPAACAWAGSVFPDGVEYGTEACTGTQVKHRGLSHYFAIYAVCLIFFYELASGNVIPNVPPAAFFPTMQGEWEGIVPLVPSMLFWLTFGCLCHIAEDFPCGGIPFPTPFHRFPCRWFTIGSETEYLTAYLLTVFFPLLRAVLPVPFYLGL